MVKEDKEILNIEDLHVRFETEDGIVYAVNGINLKLGYKRTLGLVGETGAGKTTTALAMLRLVPDPPGVIAGGSIEVCGNKVLEMDNKALSHIRGKDIAMIFQDPMTSLNPVTIVGEQIAESVRLHENVTPAQAFDRAIEMLELVGIPGARAHDYPHQFSGGMKQRVVIAIALACNPKILIADEPTTALDVTIQAQILSMIDDIQKRFGTSLILITHDLGIVAETCDKVAVMYAGEIVEFGTLEQIFDKSREHHPYTNGLFGCIPDLNSDKARLEPIRGLTPDPSDLPTGCYFSPRCEQCSEKCRAVSPAVYSTPDGQMIKCHLYSDAKEGTENE